MDSSKTGGSISSGAVSRDLNFNPSFRRAELISDSQCHRQHMHGMGGILGPATDRLIRNVKAKNVRATTGISGMSSRRKSVYASVANACTAFVNDNDVSDEAEDNYQNFMEDEIDATVIGAKGKKGSPWQRMKWTDKVVRLLILAVSHVGDDGAPEGVSATGCKRKPGSLQRKGKWKSVSKFMMEKGCYVSPQQCEDKFNDLNKRYKRLNEILGQGASCQVVENPVLLDSMNHISPKIKESVRRILSSKHLFYREMCAYHNGQKLSASPYLDLQGISIPSSCNNGNYFEECGNENGDHGNYCESDAGGEFLGRINDIKRRKISADKCAFRSLLDRHEIFGSEIAANVHESSMKKPLEHIDWISNRILHLHEQRVRVQAQVFELEKQRFEWQRFCCSKDGELDGLRLQNEKFRLENERMSLQLKKKEMEIYSRRSAESLTLAYTVMDMQGRD